MSLGMLNAAVLNGAAINAGASTVLVLATTAWTADAQVAPFDAIQTHALVADWDGTVNGIFDETLTNYAWANFSSSGVTTWKANVIWGAGADWNNNIAFQPLIYTNVYASAGFDTSTTWWSIANAKLGETNWTATHTNTFEPQLIQRLDSDLTGTVTWTSTTGDVNRGVIGNWNNEASIWIESTITSGGNVSHEGYFFPESTLSWTNTNELTATFTNGAWLSPSGTWNAAEIQIHAAKGTLTHTSELDPFASKTQFGAPPAMVLTTGLSIAPTLIHDSHVSTGTTTSFAGSGLGSFAAKMSSAPTVVSMNGVPTKKGALKAPLSITTNLESKPVKLFYGVLDVNGTLSFDKDDTVIGALVAYWTGTGGSLSSAVTVSLVPAPLNRQYKLSEWQRNWETSGSSERSFEVSI